MGVVHVCSGCYILFLLLGVQIIPLNNNLFAVVFFYVLIGPCSVYEAFQIEFVSASKVRRTLFITCLLSKSELATYPYLLSYYDT